MGGGAVDRSRIGSHTNQRNGASGHECTSSVSDGRDVHEIGQATPAERFSAQIIGFPAKTLMRLTGASIDTVKSWQCARRFPNWEHMKRMERHIPAVRSFVAQEFGFSENSGAGLLAQLQQIASDSTPEAAQTRSVLRSLIA